MYFLSIQTARGKGWTYLTMVGNNSEVMMYSDVKEANVKNLPTNANPKMTKEDPVIKVVNY